MSANFRVTEARKSSSKLQLEVQELRMQNQRLSADIHKLTADWTHAREMLEHKDRECDAKLKVRICWSV
jgi:FtsZ-binding cell division protein ZapB